MRKGLKRAAAGLCAALSLSACGTTYEVPVASPDHVAVAERMLLAERHAPVGASGTSASAAMARFNEVRSRVEPAAERFCRQATADRPGFECDVAIRVDADSAERNAYQFYEGGRPVIAVTLPLIRDARSPDELAFVLGHEFGHHVGRHITKGNQQALAGALILGTLAAYGQAAGATAAAPQGTAAD